MTAEQIEVPTPAESALENAPLARAQFLFPTSQRPAAIEIPFDITDQEWLELIAYLATVLAPTLRARRPTSRIIVPAK